ncbi:MAG TPA: amino acid permease [Planctomycetota bacterium]|nr:amino acid permease [Planctomycetota bacterium]
MADELPRRIGFWGGSALMVGIILGSGIFLAPTVIAGMLGSPWVVLAFWVAGGILSLFGALTFAELAAALPRSGGIYVYLNEGLGPRVAFTFGWTYLLLIKPFAAAAVGIVFANHLNALLGVDWNPPIVACVMILLLTAVNAVTVRGSSVTAIALTALKLASLGAIVALGLLLGKGSAANFASTPAPVPLWKAAAPVMYGVLWTYDGWADVSAVTGEVENPARTLPRILFMGTVATVGVYVVVNVVYCSLIPLAEMRHLTTVAPVVLERLLGGAGGRAVAAMIVLSTLGATHAAVLTGARVTWAQARDGLLFRFLGRVHPTFRTPDVSLWIQAALCCASVVYLRRFKDLSEGYGFLMWIFYALTAAAVLILRRRRPDLERPYKCWGYPAVPLAFIVASVGMTALYIAQSPRQTLPWLAVLLLGLPAHIIWTRFAGTGRPAESRTGPASL